MYGGYVASGSVFVCVCVFGYKRSTDVLERFLSGVVLGGAFATIPFVLRGFRGNGGGSAWYGEGLWVQVCVGTCSGVFLCLDCLRGYTCRDWLSAMTRPPGYCK